MSLKSKCQNGIIKITSSYRMDGEYCSSNYKYTVVVTKYWGKNKNYKPKEVKTSFGKYYRETSKFGWRCYNKESKQYYNSKGTNTNIIFIEK